MRIAGFLLAFFFSVQLQAQSRALFNRISVDDAMGLASNRVFCLHQDSKGYIWVGTANGIQRFDGNKFIRFEANMPMDAVSQIVEDKQGKFWLNYLSRREFGIFDPRTYQYKQVGIKPKGTIPVRSAYKIWKNRHNEIFLTVQNYGLFKYDPSQNAFTEDIPFRLPEGWKPVMRVFEDVKMGRLYIPCFDSGLAVYDERSREIWTRHNNPQNLPLLNNVPMQQGITTFYIDRERRQWVFHWPEWNGGGQLMHCFDSTGKKLDITSSVGKELLGYAEYHDVYETGKDNLWIAGMNVLYSWDPATRKFYYHKSESEHNYFIQYDVVNQILEDKDGSLWIATDKGMFFTNAGTNRFVTSVMFDESKGSNAITDILQLENGDYWLANWGNGVIVMDSSFRKKEHNIYATPVPSSWPQATKNAVKLVWSLHQQKSTGKVWIGTNGGTLNIHDPQTGRSTWLAPREFNNSTIRTITEDKEGTLWFGTQGGRLIRYDDGEFQVVQDFKTILNKVFVDRSGWIWVSAFEKGMFAIDKKTGRLLQHYSKNNGPNSLFSNTANDIEQIDDSTLVYGAGALNFVNKRSGKVTIYDFYDGLPSNTVERLRVDKQGYLWIMTTSGLCRYNPSSHTITPFGRKDGIIFSDLAKDCDYVTNNGQIIFGGENALMFFDPRYMEQNRKPRPAVITDIKLFNDYIALDSLLQLKEARFRYDQNSFSFYFSTVSFLMNDKMKFYYKLTGADEDWVSADRNYFVNYSHLPPGDYVFHVYSVNSEGVRSEKVTEFAFTIDPPFWRTNLFIFLVILLVAGLIYLIHRLRINRLIAVQKLRNRVARDLHDDMGSTLSTINILSSMAKSKINSDIPKATEFITKISDNSQRMMEAMDDIVWSIKPSNDSMEKITARMREFATSVLEARGIDLDFKVDASVNDIRLNMEARRDFFLVFKEAVNNAAKYSKAANVVVYVATHHHKLSLLVEDDGAGFIYSDDSRGNGMGNMQKRADAMKGRLVIKTKPGEGTKITLTIPIT